MYRMLISKIHMKEKRNRKPNVLMTRESRTVKRDLYVTENLSFKNRPLRGTALFLLLGFYLQ